jgi:DNA uptake protein ComE-like DNA-binding protein
MIKILKDMMEQFILRNKKGFALIVAVGILCVLTLATITFTAMCRLEERNSRNYNYETQATYLAKAGIAKAIAELKNHTRSNFIWDAADGWYSGYSDTLLDGQGEYSVSITDCSAQINLNDTGNSNLDLMLEKLPSITSSEADDIITYRDSLSGGVFQTKEQIKQVSGLIDDGESYSDFKDYITVDSYINSDFSRSPVNLNTASSTVLEAVLTDISDGVNTISSSEASSVATDIINNRPINTWSDFDSVLDDSVSGSDITSAEQELIMDNANPNNTKSSTNTTEFIFHAGGYFELESTGTYKDPAGNTVASRKIQAVVKTHEVKYETTKEDFEAGTCWKVTYWDNCPVVSTEDHTATDFSDNGWDQGPSNYTTITDSLKLGFWEDFDEDYPDNARTYWDSRDGAAFEIANNSTHSYGNELYIYGDNATIVIDLGDSDDSKWQWPDASFRCWTEEERDDGGDDDTEAPPYYVIWLLAKVQDFSWNDYILGQKKEYWDWVGHYFDATEWELPSTAETNYEWSTQYRAYKAKKMVVSEDKVEVYRNDMINAVNANEDVQTDYAAGSFGVWGRCDEPGNYDKTTVKIDNIRIIPMSPDESDNYAHYDSIVFDSGVTVEGGAIGATVTIPSSASSDSEKVFLQMKTQDNSWVPASVETIESYGATTASSGSGIQYKVNFKTSDNRTDGTKPYFSETPVVEDITLIYMPATQITYYREAAE